MERSHRALAMTAVLNALVGAVSAVPDRTVEAFSQRGVIVDPQTFFTAAAPAPPAAADPQAGRRALVTQEGVYAFLETPQNEQHLSRTVPGSVVQVEGRLLREGSLVWIDSLALVTTVPLIDFAGFRGQAGEPVRLAGVNKCQCGLEVGPLPRSCALGHLHHLEAEDGLIYHYLRHTRGEQLFLGQGFHFEPVVVQARRLPGHYLLVEEASVQR